MDFEKREEAIRLFDIYGILLTDKQQEYFKAYYFFDYSLSEIASNYNISRNAVFDQIKKVLVILEEYENKLKLVNKNERILNIIDNNQNDYNLQEIKKIIEE